MSQIFLPTNTILIIVIVGSIGLYTMSFFMLSLLDCKDAVSMTPEECEKHFSFGWNFVLPIVTFSAGTFCLIVAPQLFKTARREQKV